MPDFQWSTSLRDSEYGYTVFADDNEYAEPSSCASVRDELAEAKSLDTSLVDEDDVHFIETPFTIAQRRAALQNGRKRGFQTGVDTLKANPGRKKQNICTSDTSSTRFEVTPPTTSSTLQVASSSQSTAKTSPPHSEFETKNRVSAHSSSSVAVSPRHSDAGKALVHQQVPPPRTFPPLRPARVGLQQPARHKPSDVASQRRLCFSTLPNPASRQTSRPIDQADSISSTDPYYDGFFCWGNELEVFRDDSTSQIASSAPEYPGAISSSYPCNPSDVEHENANSSRTSKCSNHSLSPSPAPIVVLSSDSEDSDSDVFAFHPRRESLSTASTSVATDEVDRLSPEIQTMGRVGPSAQRRHFQNQGNPRSQKELSQQDEARPFGKTLTRSGENMQSVCGRWAFPHATAPRTRQSTIERGNCQTPAASATSLTPSAFNLSASSYTNTGIKKPFFAQGYQPQRLQVHLGPNLNLSSQPSVSSTPPFFSENVRGPKRSSPTSDLSTCSYSPPRVKERGVGLGRRRNSVGLEAKNAIARRFKIPAIATGAPPHTLPEVDSPSHYSSQDKLPPASGYAIRKLPPDVSVTVQELGGGSDDGVRRKLTLFKPSARTQF